MDAFKHDFPCHSEITVAWGEMDALKHVNNVAYFRYFEIARIDFLSRLGMLDNINHQAIGPVLSDNNARYKRPVTFPDTLTVGVHVGELLDDRFTLHYTVFSQAQQAVTTLGHSQVVMFDFKTGQKAPLGETLTTKLKQYQRI